MLYLRKTLTVALALAVGLVLGTGVAEAQDGTGFGIKGGVTLAKLDGDFGAVDGAAVDFENGRGFAVGIFAAMPLSDGLSLQPELMYVRRTTELDLPSLDDTVDEAEFEVRTSYVELPVLLKYTAGDGSVRPILFAGPSVALNLDAETHAEFGDMEETTDIKDEISDIDLGVALGAGLELGDGLSVEGRYTLGLTDVDDSDDEGGEELKWRTLLFAIGYVF